MANETARKTCKGIAWIDCTRPIDDRLNVWPGDRSYEMRQGRHGGCVLSSFSATCHLGTHVDAPMHLDPDQIGVDEIPIGRFLGHAEVVDARAAAQVDREVLGLRWRPRAPRILVRTDSFDLGAEINGGFTALAPGLASWLAAEGVQLVGVDVPSVDVFDSETLEVHHEMMSAGLTWIEGLWLGEVAPGLYDMLALPMALVGVEASPIRVVLRPAESQNRGL